MLYLANVSCWFLFFVFSIVTGRLKASGHAIGIFTVLLGMSFVMALPTYIVTLAFTGAN